ncbi:MAG: DUF4175 family protein [Salinivenus sp.]
MSEQTARLVSRLRRRLRQTARRMTYAEMAFGLAVAGGSGAALWLLAALLEASFWFGTTARTALAAAGATVGLGIAAAVLARPLAKWIGLVPGPSDEDVARAVGDHHPRVADRLVNLLHLAEGKRSHAPAPLVDQAVQNLADDLDDVSFEAVEDFGRAREALRLASVPFVGVLAFLLIAPSTFLNASERLLAPGTEFDPPAPFQLSVRPGDTQVTTGDTLEVTAQATGEVPRRARLLLRDTTGSTEEVALEADSAGRFRHAVPNVRAPLQYRVVSAPVRTDWHRVRVAARPRVQELQLTVTPPSYTGRSSRTLDPNVGDVSALPGARVEVEATVGGPDLTTAALDFDSGRTDTLSLSDSVATGAFAVEREDTYQLRLQSDDGIPNRSPVNHRIDLRTDAEPSASFESPGRTTDLAPDLVQPLQVRLRDDFGVRRAALFYRRAGADSGEGEEEFSSIDLPLSNPDERTQTLSYEWLLVQDSGLDPQPGDEIEYFVRVWDNDTVNGPKSGTTRTQRLRMPSLAQQYDALEETQGSADEKIDSLQQQADSSSQQFERLRRELRQSRESDWQNERQVEQLKEKQGTAQDAAESLSQSIEEMTQQMQRNGLSSQQTAEQFQELKRVADELSSPEPQQALDELQESLSEDQSPRQRQQALENAEQQQQDFQDQLERTDELFEQLKSQQQLDELGNRTEDLRETQDALEEETAERMSDDAEDGDSSDPAAPDSTQEETSSSDRTDGRPDSTGSSPDSTTPPPSDSQSTDASPDAQAEDPGASNEDLSRKQEQAAEEMEQLMEEMEQTQQEMEDNDSAPRQQLQKMNQQLQEQQMPQQMQENSEQLRNNQLQQAQQGQQQMQQQLQRMQQQMQQMKKKMQAQQQQQNVTGLRSAFENTLRLSKKQEALRSTVDAQSDEDDGLPARAREQNVLVTGLETVTDSLRSIARRSPSMTQAVQTETGEALQAMESAVTALDEREAGAASDHQKTSMTHLNELALLLSDLLSQMQQQQGMGQGMTAQQMMQQLQQTSGQQQKLNNQIQQQLNEAQGERLSQGQQAQRREKLAQQQRNLKEELSNLESEDGAEDQVMGDLDKIQDQMETSAEALEQGRSRDELREQQEQILSRLLNAQKSLRTQGKQQERRGETAEGDAPSRTPEDRPDTEEDDSLRRDLLRSLEMGYSSSYEDLIREYFDLLREQDPDTTSTPE